MITRVTSAPAIAWPAGWEDVEVVDSVLVEERAALPAPRAGLYDSGGRLAPGERFGRLVSVLA